MSAPDSTPAPGGLEVLRRSLWPFAPLYGLVTGVRNGLFDSGQLSSTRLPVPVVSVGNLTVGGTGKTPLVGWLVEHARRHGVAVGVLARGYGREPGRDLNDEGMLLAGRFPGLLQEQDPDRVAGGRRLVERGASWIVLDDGFQHRRLARDVDIVCLDAAAPFGRGGLLPSGDLRESVRGGLRRADLIVLTRSDRVPGASLDELAERLRRRGLREEAPVLRAVHAPRRIVSLDRLGEPSGDAARAGTEGADDDLQTWRGRRVFAAAAIARPGSFARTLTMLGCELVGSRWFADHHRFTDAEARALDEAAAREHAALVVTEKDAVKLAGCALPDPSRVHVLQIDLEFVGRTPSPAALRLDPLPRAVDRVSSMESDVAVDPRRAPR
jgi:tetraacyldisaccharide 4'-kinase